MLPQKKKVNNKHHITKVGQPLNFLPKNMLLVFRPCRFVFLSIIRSPEETFPVGYADTRALTEFLIKRIDLRCDAPEAVAAENQGCHISDGSLFLCPPSEKKPSIRHWV